MGDYDDFSPSFIEPPRHIVSITPSDANDLDHEIRCIAFGTAGDLKITTDGGETETIPSGVLSAGQQHIMVIKKVFATGTTATDIWGWY